MSNPHECPLCRANARNDELTRLFLQWRQSKPQIVIDVPSPIKAFELVPTGGTGLTGYRAEPVTQVRGLARVVLVGGFHAEGFATIRIGKSKWEPLPIAMLRPSANPVRLGHIWPGQCATIDITGAMVVEGGAILVVETREDAEE